MSERPEVDDYATDVHRWWHLSRASTEIDPRTIRDAFMSWQLLSLEQEEVVSDPRTMPALVALLERTG